jgi:hypothetical protein
MGSITYQPVVRCELMHLMVPIDQTQRQCALEHHCSAGCVCPEAAYFSEVKEAYHSPMAWDRSGGTCV